MVSTVTRTAAGRGRVPAGRRAALGVVGRAGSRRSTRPGRRWVRGRDRGSVTVEAAIGLSSLVVVMALCLAGLAAMVAQVRTTDAAGEAARLAARGDEAAARAAVERLAPSGSELRLSGSALVTAQVAAPPLGGLLPGLRLGAMAVAMREPAEP